MAVNQRVHKNLLRDKASSFIIGALGVGANNRKFIEQAHEVCKDTDLCDFVTDVALAGMLYYWDFQGLQMQALSDAKRFENMPSLYYSVLDALGLVPEIEAVEKSVARMLVCDVETREQFLSFCYIWLVTFLGNEVGLEPYKSAAITLFGLVRKLQVRII